MTTLRKFVQLPYELFENIIIPDLLSEHLHALIIDRDRPTWHAFYVLPLVSRDFNETCRKLMPGVVGSKPSSRTPLNLHVTRNRAEEDEEDTENDEEEFEGVDNEVTEEEEEEEEEEDAYWDPGQQIDYARIVCQKALRPSSDASNSHHHFAMKMLLSNPSARTSNWYKEEGYGTYSLGRRF
ncbi:hypothetical protein M422DRAFT_48459 [Sphaerobolus stellatus SS14]|uniref:Uncharacterized protein n=1 Tax=Sphaerobolus stellatus (strain SS14) TaxID=990650 RepID=A0A0C9VTZ4_SPHS4|nr:hypothetical protein M422DRAFT_48459 [Sphaerobolus stellatus SS14]